MPKNPNRLTRLWQELKRRKVFGVVTTYAATAYIIIEVTNNLVGPLNLPVWIAKLVILLLGTGLPVAVILSWIFDFTPQGIKKTESLEESESKEIVAKPVKRRLRLSYVLNAILIIAVIVLAYREIFKRDTLERLRSSGDKISVAVMPFQNMTNDTIWNNWQDWIQNQLITSLTSSEELKVRQIETINELLQSQGLTNYASITPSIASNISKKLDANVAISGTIKQVGTLLHINTTLIDTKTKETFKSFQIDCTPENIVPILDSLSGMVKDFLKLSKLKKEGYSVFEPFITTNSPEAYGYFISGLNAFKIRDYSTSVKWFSRAVTKDSNFIYAAIRLANAFWNQAYQGTPSSLDSAKKWCLKVYKKRDQISEPLEVSENIQYTLLFKSPVEATKYLKQLVKIDDQSPDNHFLLGLNYVRLSQYDKAIPELEKSLKIYDKWSSKPVYPGNYVFLGSVYHKTGQYRKEKKLYKKAEKDFPDDFGLVRWQAVLALTLGNDKRADELINKYISLIKERSVPEVFITSGLGGIYWGAKLLDKAEEYYRKALSLKPEDPWIMNALGWFLIDSNRNLDDGLKINDKALEISPNEYYFLDCKGWGLFKLGRFKEAQDILEKAFSLDSDAIHRYAVGLHLEEVKKAVARMK